MNQSISQNRDGFQVWGDEFILPVDTCNLDPQSKRAVTICNLFINHQYSVSDVARVLDEDCRKVILVLIRKGIVKDRRVRQTDPPKGIERRVSDGSRSVELKIKLKQEY
jgi:hypothetical protein